MNGRTTLLTPDECPHHQWRVRIPTHNGATGTAVHVDVDVDTRLLTLRLPDGTTAAMNATTARAIKDTLSAAIFGSLGAPGPWLYAERYDPATATWQRP